MIASIFFIAAKLRSALATPSRRLGRNGGRRAGAHSTGLRIAPWAPAQGATNCRPGLALLPVLCADRANKSAIGQTVGPHSPRENSPGHEARLGDHNAAGFGDRHKMGENRGWRHAIGFSGAQTARYSSLSASSIRIVPTTSGLNWRGRSRRVSHSHSKSRQTCGRSHKSRSRRRGDNCAHSGPAGFLSSAISSAEQHIVHASQAFPGAAAMESFPPRPSTNRNSGSASVPIIDRPGDGDPGAPSKGRAAIEVRVNSPYRQ